MEVIDSDEYSVTWRGVHPGRSIPVWVAFASGIKQWEPRQLALFERTMLHANCLSHGVIRRSFAHGLLDAGVALQLGLPDSSDYPYWVWEAPPDASTSGIGDAASWSVFREQLYGLLDALAHAHGRGILHLGGLHRFVRQVQDKVYIHGFGFPRTLLGILGTVPGDCAPELRPHAAYQVGPWTDLYSLGVLINQVVFEGGLLGLNRQSEGLISLPMRAKFALPEQFPVWVRRLLAAAPGDRYPTAAHAAQALLRLEDSGKAIETPLFALQLEKERRAKNLMALPSNWRQRQLGFERMRGISPDILRVEIRRIPLVGFESERDELWAKLSEVCEQGLQRNAWILGEGGCGKSRLSQWLCERAAELGVAHSVRMDVRPNGVPGEALRDLLLVALRLQGVSAADYADAVQYWLKEHGGENRELSGAILELLLPKDHAASNGRFGVRLESLSARRAVVMRVLERLAAVRPLILVLGDAQRSADCAGLIPLIQARAKSTMLVITTNSAELLQRPNERIRLEQSLSDDIMQLDTLSDQEHIAFVERLLGLEGLLATRVAQRTKGMPVFAIELIDDWLAQDLLSQSSTGLVLVNEAEIPDSLQQLWRQRISRVCQNLSEAKVEMLEVAAALGLMVDDDEWREVCDDPKGVYDSHSDADPGGLVFSPTAARDRFELVNELLRRRLVEETDTGWRFSHAAVWEHLRSHSTANGRWRGTHLSCAQLMLRRMSQGVFGSTERYALHLLEGGESLASVKPMLQAVEERSYSAGPRMALGLLDRCERTMTEHGLTMTDRRWGEIWLSRARLSLLVGDVEGADDWARRALEHGAKQDWDDTVSIARFYRAQVNIRRGDLVKAGEELDALRSSIPEGREPEMMARTLFGMASIARYRHAYDKALELYGESGRYFAYAGRKDGEASCWRDMGALYLTLGDLGHAEKLYQKAYKRYEKLGKRHEMANCINGVAEVARWRGDYVSAESGYLRAIDLYESIGAGQLIVPRTNMAMLGLQLGRYQSALRVLEACKKVIEEEERQWLLGSVCVALVTASAGIKDWERFDYFAGLVDKASAASGFAERDCAWAAEKAANLARTAGESRRATWAAQVALSQFRVLEDRDGLVRMQSLLVAIGR
jgi:eukaryotic-like serine/threonine-protein kinase